MTPDGPEPHAAPLRYMVVLVITLAGVFVYAVLQL
jgi:hypothetical protein